MPQHGNPEIIVSCTVVAKRMFGALLLREASQGILYVDQFTLRFYSSEPSLLSLHSHQDPEFDLILLHLLFQQIEV